jgi:hypothetical protein
MSLLTPEGRITVRPFAWVPSLADLHEIQQEPCSISDVSSVSVTDGPIDLAEGCMLTKSVKYTHQLTHWVKTACSGDAADAKELVSRKLIIMHHNC